jgi:hypothetical protein
LGAVFSLALERDHCLPTFALVAHAAPLLIQNKNMKKNLIYSIASLLFAIVIGGAVYEHLALVPQWTAGPPLSLALFQGEHGLKPGRFWIPIHPVTLLFLLTSLFLHWRTDRRRPLLIAGVGYLLILVVTSIYFVPELMELTTTPFSPVVNEELKQRALTWERLSLARLAVLLVLGVVLINGLTRPGAWSAKRAAEEASFYPA